VHKNTKRSGEAERSGERGFGGLPRSQYITTRPCAVEKGNSSYCNSTRPRHEARTRVISSSLRRFRSKFSALGTPAKPNQDVLRNTLLCPEHFFVHRTGPSLPMFASSDVLKCSLFFSFCVLPLNQFTALTLPLFKAHALAFLSSPS
jgi:hypothetical protein